MPDEVKLDPSVPLTLQQALELARQQNRDLQEAMLSLERSQAALREATAARYPNLQLRSNLSRSDSASGELSNARQRELFGDLATQQDTASTSLDGTVELSYDLYTSGLRPAQISAANSQVRFDELEVERIAAQLQFDITDAYYNLQQRDEEVRIARAAVERFEQNLKDAEALEKAGVGTKFDVLQARVDLGNAQQDLTQALSQQLISRRNLTQLLSLPQSADIFAADPIVPAGDWSLSLEESIVLAYKNRAEMEQELVQRDIGAERRRAAQAALGPQVSVFANYNALEVFSDSLNSADGYALGARLQWNLYDGGAARSRALQQEKNMEIAETRFANLRGRVRFQVEQSYFQLQSNKTNINTAGVALEEARERLRLARLRFQAGVGTQSEVIDAITALTQAEGNLSRAIIEYNRALASIQRAVSNLDGSLAGN
ncbi:TolC family protein [[Phormidium] sp. ETS-05]|uniref:TolC family protein n=1 Tax=[Phormidium] sp. ETS-05 TaxID=222819 RepID=UPI0018EF2DA0|nr:TolC family protein [[Phormidium] sp. ETS-05]